MQYFRKPLFPSKAKIGSMVVLDPISMGVVSHLSAAPSQHRLLPIPSDGAVEKKDGMFDTSSSWSSPRMRLSGR